MIIDSHQHFWDKNRFIYPWLNPGLKVLYRNFLPGDIKVNLKENYVERTVVVQAVSSYNETAWLLELAEKNSFIGGVVGWVDLESIEAGRKLDQFMISPRFKGIRHQVEDEADREWLVRPAVLRGLGEVAARGLGFDVLVKHDQLRLLDKVTDSCRGLRMVIDHASKPNIRGHEFKQWAKDIEHASQLPGVMCKISGLITEDDHRGWTVENIKPYVEHLIDCFGYRRLMFGSDWPVCLLACSYEQVLYSMFELTKNVECSNLNKLFYLNAKEFYKIE